MFNFYSFYLGFPRKFSELQVFFIAIAVVIRLFLIRGTWTSMSICIPTRSISSRDFVDVLHQSYHYLLLYEFLWQR